MREHKPVNIIPFYIYNRKAFIEAEHPIIHPREDAYDEYWFSVTEKVIYGKWGFDSNGSEGGWRWMPGCL